MLAIVLPTPPAAFLQRASQPSAEASGEHDALHFELPADASPLQRNLASYLQHKLHCPELLLIIVFAVRLRVWLGIAAWVMCAPIAGRLQIGPLYVLGTILALILCNLGERKAGEASAYSIFNHFRALPGQLTADEVDQQVRQGRM